MVIVKIIGFSMFAHIITLQGRNNTPVIDIIIEICIIARGAIV
ncbi:MAG: hypothetical protein PVI51_00280 [candidate division WOR-3 bacterium]